jgi:hypothetical protein
VADLLVCEHLAAQTLSAIEGHCAARTRIIQASGRTFLESERFDRSGDLGRSAAVTLFAVEAALIGAGPHVGRCFEKLIRAPLYTLRMQA